MEGDEKGGNYDGLAQTLGGKQTQKGPRIFSDQECARPSTCDLTRLPPPIMVALFILVRRSPSAFRST